MTGILGKSWRTSILGYGQLAVDVIWTGYQGANGHLGTDDWIRLGGSALIAVALAGGNHRLEQPHSAVLACARVPATNSCVLKTTGGEQWFPTASNARL